MQSMVDQLTGVFNRRYLDDKLAGEIQRARRYGRKLSLLMIDLDRFKEINDTLGHKGGDAILIETAQLLRTHSREVDLVFRYGGDEFVILLPETPYEAALAKAENLRRETADRPFSNPLDPSRPVHVTLSIGVTAFTLDIKGAEELLHVADEALYTAKREGRNRLHGAVKVLRTN
jgi:diguanylate cyclase (GGDEF)-like protein